MESHKLSIRVEQLEAFLVFLAAAQTEIRYTASPVEEIIRRHGNMRLFTLCMENCQCGSNFSEAWSDAVVSGTEGLGLDGKDITLIHDFGAGFGTSDVDGQLAHCKLYTELITARLEDAKESKKRKAKLYLMLGIFAGMAAALLLW
jgi:stage III sporulation protein AB